MLSDDLPIQEDHPSTLHSETSFTDVNQVVQKTEIDLFGTLITKQKGQLGIHFIGTLDHFNGPLTQSIWTKNETNLLDLPNPFN